MKKWLHVNAISGDRLCIRKDSIIAICEYKDENKCLLTDGQIEWNVPLDAYEFFVAVVAKEEEED